jgi:uncharacterized protein (DUF952 family)
MARIGPSMKPLVYKVLEMQCWREAQATGHFPGSADDLRDGFIHFSTAAQLPGTLRKYFAGQRGLVLLGIPADPFGDTLRWEASASGSLYPHLYGVLPASAVLQEWPLALDDVGQHVLPQDLA